MSRAEHPFFHIFLFAHGLVQGLWFLLRYRCCALTGTFLGYPVVALCCVDPSALGLQDQTLHVPLQITNAVDVRVDQLINLVLVPGSGRGCQPARFPLSSPPACALHPLPWLLHPLQPWAKDGGQSSCFHS